nr:glycosyltransferase family 39 protein [Hanstruepera flava]
MVFCFYNHVSIFPDSEDYTNLAQYLGNFSLTNYTGQRTPGFPALIAISGQNLNITVFIQTVLGLLNCYLLFDFSRSRTKNERLAFWITIIVTSFLHVVFYEFAILTETLSFTLVILSFWYIEKHALLNREGKLKHLFILSLLFGVLYLTRPMFIYFPIGFLLFYIIKNFNSNFKGIIFKSLSVIAVPFFCFYGWNKLNENNIGYFTSSYYLGINLAQTATSFFEKAPDEDRLIRDIFVKHRTYVENNLSRTMYAMTVWRAYDELLEETQLSPPELSAELGRISKNLFVAHPDLYAKQVFISWRDFWGGASSLLWNADEFKNKTVKHMLVGLWLYIQKPVLILFNFLFLLFSLIKMIRFMKFKCKIWDSDLFLILIILSGSLAQALVAYGTNSRFCFPFFALIVYFVMSNLFNLKILKPNYANSPSS